MRVSVIIALSVAIILALEPTPSQSVAPIVVAGAAAAGRVAVPAIKQVFHRYASRKAAMEAAKRASNGVKPVSHGAHKPGYSPHFHHTGKNGKPTDFVIKRPAGSDKSYRVHEHFQYPRRQG